jgi:hypothetical protein
VVVRALNGPAHGLARAAIQFVRQDFALPYDLRDTHVFLARRGEVIYEPHLGRFNMYLPASGLLDSAWLAYLAGHEAFHRACANDRPVHSWADEMLASVAAIRFLRHQNQAWADRFIFEYRVQAQACSQEKAILAFRTPNQPDSAYGRVQELGLLLEEFIGFEHMRRMALMVNARGERDAFSWAYSLPSDIRDEALAALAVEGSAT